MRKDIADDLARSLHEEVVRIAKVQGRTAAKEASYFDLVWNSRDREQRRTQRQRDERTHRMRPILTLDGLDPNLDSLRLREAAAIFKALGEALRG